jgi:hypothetical protein
MEKHLNSLTEKVIKYNRCGIGVIVDRVPKHTFDLVEKNLQLKLPEEFRYISNQVSVTSFSKIEFFEFENDPEDWNGIIKNNLEIRKNYEKDSNGQSKERMDKILVLANDDGGSVFMITQDSSEKPAPVVWCDYGDMYHYAITGQFRNPHDEWPSFTDFFEFLVNDLEKRTAEEE